ncbi:MAG: DUF4249 domain-containing protein [Crocinitomicaceae bacterium]|nr:DUF4249 domain-containing protein [Crocinitomicaceae bacterium]
MKTLKYLTIIGFAALFMPACQKVIDVTVDDADENFVIDAFYDANAELVGVRITRTKALFSPEPNETIDNADVTLTTPSGDVFNLVNLGNGNYELTNLTPEFDLSYKMTVLMEGEVFEATAFLPTPIPLDSLTQEYQPASLFGPEGYIIFMNLTDPGGENFYRAMRIVNGEPLTGLGDQFLFDNSFTSGNVQTVPFFASRYQPDDTITVELRSYSREAAQYFSDLLSLAGDGGQSAAPANPRTNWSNGALGVFNAYGYDAKTIIIVEE